MDSVVKKKTRIDSFAFIDLKQIFTLFEMFASDFNRDFELLFFSLFSIDTIAGSTSQSTDKNKNKKNLRAKFVNLQLKMSLEKN